MRTNKEIFKHLEELIIENESLRKENRQIKSENSELRSEVKRLRKRIDEMETAMEERINKAVETAVAMATTVHQATVAEKNKEIQRLKAQINKDSSNSSKPPGSNGYKKVQNNREKSTRKQGGQPGHPGTRFNIPNNLEELVATGKAEHIIICNVPEGAPYVSDWTVDLKVTTVFTEHRREPGKPQKIEYGAQIKSIAVYLCVIGLIAYKRLSQFFHEISHNIITVSKGSLAEFNRSAAGAVDLGPFIQGLLNGKVIHVDETPIKTTERPNMEGLLETAEKTTFNAYIRTYSNSMTTVLTANAYKTEKSVIADNILTEFHGIVSQDHESKFYNFGNSNATCGAHLTRELKGMSELQMLKWAADVRQFFLEMNKHKNNDVHNNKFSCEPILLRHFETCYDEFLQEGKQQLEIIPANTFGWDELRRMVNRLEKHKDNYLLFIRDYDAPFTNNLAERDLRHCKTRQKVSGCFRTWLGVLDYCKIRSVLDTAKKRKQNLFNTLLSLFSKTDLAGQ